MAGGVIYDYARGRCVRLDDITWDPATSTLGLDHRAASGVPEREFTGTRAGDQLSGTFIQGGQSVPWSVQRQWPHGLWTSGSSIPQYATFSMSATGKWEWGGMASDPWQGKTFGAVATGVAERWDSWPVVVSGATINFPAGGTASLTNKTMQGTSGAQSWVATRATDGIPWGS